LSVPVVTTDDVALSWSQPATTQTAVRVYRDSVNVSGDLSAGATSYNDNDLANATYTYTIRNTNGVAESVDSNDEDAVVSHNPPLTDPSGFTATSTHSDRNALAWTNGDGTAQTEIYRGTSPDPTTLIHTASAGTSSYNDDGLNQTTLYYYRIRHIKGGSLSDYVSDSETTLTTSFTGVNLVADEPLDDIIISWSLVNPPVAPVVSHGDWSDTEGAESVSGPVAPITSPRTVTTYSRGIVPNATGTDVTGTLSFLRVVATSQPLVTLAEQINVQADFEIGPP
jgi:titin